MFELFHKPVVLTCWLELVSGSVTVTTVESEESWRGESEVGVRGDRAGVGVCGEGNVGVGVCGEGRDREMGLGCEESGEGWLLLLPVDALLTLTLIAGGEKEGIVLLTVLPPAGVLGVLGALDWCWPEKRGDIVYFEGFQKIYFIRDALNNQTFSYEKFIKIVNKNVQTIKKSDD